MAKREMKKPAPVNTEELKPEVEEAEVAAAEEPETRTFALTTTRLNLRANPSLEADVLLILPIKARVEIITDIDEVWSSIKYHGKIGYVMSKYIVKE